MRTKNTLHALLLLTILILPAAIGPALARAQSQSPAAQPKVADFSWLEGEWRGQTKTGQRVETAWFRPLNGVMMGMFRLTDGEKTLVLELFTLMESPEGLTFRFRHFNPELVPWEKEAPLTLQLLKWDGKVAEFENRAHSLPKRSWITRHGPDSYDAKSELIHANGQTSFIEVNVHRVR